jgi:hypothetical protein
LCWFHVQYFFDDFLLNLIVEGMVKMIIGFGFGEWCLEGVDVVIGIVAHAKVVGEGGAFWGKVGW